MHQVTVCKQFEFAYAHHLPRYNGKCCEVHGHTGVIEIELSGVKDSEIYPGMTADFYDIKKNMGPIIEKLDHKNLNMVLNDTPGFLEYLWQQCNDVRTVKMEDGSEVIPPTSENIVYWLKMMIRNTWPQACLSRIRFWESPSSYAEWKA